MIKNSSDVLFSNQMDKAIWTIFMKLYNDYSKSLINRENLCAYVYCDIVQTNILKRLKLVINNSYKNQWI